MDIKLIEDLAALQRCASYVKAAEERHVTHPAFGRRIRALEDWAGVPLVASARAPVTLTPEGQALLAQARENLDPARVPKVHAETVAKQNAGLLSIVETFITPNLKDLPQADRAQAPQMPRHQRLVGELELGREELAGLVDLFLVIASQGLLDQTTKRLRRARNRRVRGLQLREGHLHS